MHKALQLSQCIGYGISTNNLEMQDVEFKALKTLMAACLAWYIWSQKSTYDGLRIPGWPVSSCRCIRKACINLKDM